MPWPGPPAYSGGAKRKETSYSRSHCEPRPSPSGLTTRVVHAVPSEDYQHAAAALDCPLCPRSFLVQAGTSAVRLCAPFRPRPRDRLGRQVRDRAPGLSAPQVSLLPEERGKVDLHHMPQSAHCAEDAGGYRALLRRLPLLSRGRTGEADCSKKTH